MGDFGDFTTYFFFFLFSPYFWVMIIILAFWILFISYLKKKHGENSKLLLNLLGAIVGILIIIAYPLGCTIFSGPVRLM